MDVIFEWIFNQDKFWVSFDQNITFGLNVYFSLFLREWLTKKSPLVLSNGLAPNRRQAIPWTKDVQVD